MSIGQQGADLNNQGQGLVERLREVVSRNWELAVYVRDNRPGTYTLVQKDDAHVAVARQLAPFRLPLQQWRNEVSLFLQEHSEELWASWPTVAQQLDRTFDNSTAAIEYALGAEQWVRSSLQGFLPALKDEASKAMAIGGVGLLVLGVVVLIVLSRR